MSPKCNNCGVSVFKLPLKRVNETGVNGIWWCAPCIKANEPELYKNIKEDESQVERDLINIFYPNIKEEEE